jgi:hypothetical protein
MTQNDAVYRHRQRTFSLAIAEQTPSLAGKIDFLDLLLVADYSKAFHSRILQLEEKQVESWVTAAQVLNQIGMRSASWIVLENRWHLGAFRVASSPFIAHLDVFYHLVGPDFYCASPDLDRGLAFDKNEYSCSLRVWDQLDGQA